MPEAGVTQGWGVPIWESHFNYTGNPDPVYWSPYDGPGHNDNGTRDPERINVANGIMTLTGLANGSTGGMAHEIGQRYGRWEVRMRSYNTGASGSLYHPVLIVWPDSDDWPEDGEYDFQEGNVGDVDAGAFIHYPHDPGPTQQIHKTRAGVALEDWHIYAIDWQPTGITGYIDGEYWYGPLSGGANSTRENIQDMPSGHLTIQLDGFHGDSGYRAAKMEIDWVKIYDNATFGSTGSITGVGGIASAAVVPSPLAGNRFRMYCTNTAAEVAPAYTGFWDQTSDAVRRKLDLTRSGSNAAVTSAETSTSNAFDVALGQWVSPPMTSAGTLQGPVGVIAALSESNTAADMVPVLSLRVVSGDGSTVRGVYASVSYPSGELPLTASGKNHLLGSNTPIACLVGDRLVLELGYSATNATATSYSGTLRYGGTAGDLETGETATVTTHSPNITFSDPAVERLFRGQTLTVVSTGTSEAFGTAVATQPPVLNLGPTGVASVVAVGTAVVASQAYVISLDSFGGETFGTLSINQTILIPTGIESEQSVSTPTRVIRTGDVFPSSIESAEALGSTALLYIQGISLLAIDSAEDFGVTVVEDPHRNIYPFSVVSATEFGTFTANTRMRTISIQSAEVFGRRGPVVKRGRWKLVQPTRVERHRLGGPWNVIYVTNVVGLTVYGTGQVLRTQENPRADDLAAAQYVWQGGRDNITEDQAIRDLWLANGYSVEMNF